MGIVVGFNHGPDVLESRRVLPSDVRVGLRIFVVSPLLPFVQNAPISEWVIDSEPFMGGNFNWAVKVRLVKTSRGLASNNVNNMSLRGLGIIMSPDKLHGAFHTRPEAEQYAARISRLQLNRFEQRVYDRELQRSNKLLNK